MEPAASRLFPGSCCLEEKEEEEYIGGSGGPNSPCWPLIAVEAVESQFTVGVCFTENASWDRTGPLEGTEAERIPSPSQ
ncbi:Leucine-Rich Repeat-Containing Protein 72 [Manis pentadactyla]|nr:Leucine-Rich Repeat-Containing Protein 72 [Manis pentadactyla]